MSTFFLGKQKIRQGTRLMLKHVKLFAVLFVVCMSNTAIGSENFHTTFEVIIRGWGKVGVPGPDMIDFDKRRVEHIDRTLSMLSRAHHLLLDANEKLRIHTLDLLVRTRDELNKHPSYSNFVLSDSIDLILCIHIARSLHKDPTLVDVIEPMAKRLIYSGDYKDMLIETLGNSGIKLTPEDTELIQKAKRLSDLPKKWDVPDNLLPVMMHKMLIAENLLKKPSPGILFVRRATNQDLVRKCINTFVYFTKKGGDLSKVKVSDVTYFNEICKDIRTKYDSRFIGNGRKIYANNLLWVKIANNNKDINKFLKLYFAEPKELLNDNKIYKRHN